MKKKQFRKANNKKPIIIGAIIILIAIVAIVSTAGSFTLEQTSSENDSISSDDPRIVEWRHVHGVGFDPDDHNTLYIATHGDFYQSISGGPPIKVDEIRADYMAFNAPPITGIPLYASGHPVTGGNTGLIKSTDGGITWQSVAKILDPPVDFHAMAISKQSPDIIIGFDSGARGLFKTIDAGKTWKTLGYPEYITALAFSPDDSEVIYAGTGKGMFKSTDGGKTWIHLNEYQGLFVHTMAFDDDGVLFVSIGTFGLIRSDDYGNSWKDLNDIDLTVSSIAADSENNQLYVGGYSSDGFQEVYKIAYDFELYELIGTNKGLK